MNKGYQPFTPSYESDLAKIQNFLQTFEWNNYESGDPFKKKKYMNILVYILSNISIAKSSKQRTTIDRNQHRRS